MRASNLGAMPSGGSSPADVFLDCNTGRMSDQASGWSTATSARDTRPLVPGGGGRLATQRTRPGFPDERVDAMTPPQEEEACEGRILAPPPPQRPGAENSSTSSPLHRPSAEGAAGGKGAPRTSVESFATARGSQTEWRADSLRLIPPSSEVRKAKDGGSDAGEKKPAETSTQTGESFLCGWVQNLGAWMCRCPRRAAAGDRHGRLSNRGGSDSSVSEREMKDAGRKQRQMGNMV
jgi:hypothetical protein